MPNTWGTWHPKRVYLFRDGPGGAVFIDYGPHKTGPKAATRPDNCACCGHRTARYMRQTVDGHECSSCLGYVAS